MRAKVLKRDGHKCRWPGGCNVTGDSNLEVHHLIPIADAPELADELSNQLSLCRDHHTAAALAYREAKDRRRRRFE